MDSLSIRSATDLKNLNEEDLRSVLMSAIRILDPLERHIADIVTDFTRTERISKNSLRYFGFALLGLCCIMPLLIIGGVEDVGARIIQIFQYVGGSVILILGIHSFFKKRSLKKQKVIALEALEVELQNAESVVNLIPEKYRMSIILNKMCEYLSDGEADSWPECVRIFKDDVHRLRQEQKFTEIIDNLQSIKVSSRATAIFSGIIAWRTF